MKQGALLLAWICIGAAGLLALKQQLRAGRRKKGMSTGSVERIYYACKMPEHQELIASIANQLKVHPGASILPASDGMPPDAAFHISDFMEKLNTFVYGTLLFYGPRMPTTQTFLLENVHSLPVGTTCVADMQSVGKGRAGNTWVSPKGCLMFSFTMQMENGRDVPFVQYVATLAVVQGIEAACLAKGLLVPDVRIKWPNDLYAGGLKLGGVLCSSTYASKKFSIVVGIGLNVDNNEPTTCLNALLHELDPAAFGLGREELLAAILTSFEELFSLFSTQGFKPLESLYYQKWLHSGQSVVIHEKDSSTTVVIQGLTPSGYLLARDTGLNEYELHPDGNSLDFFQGLIKRKLDQ